jgi:hypothetical protein
LEVEGVGVHVEGAVGGAGPGGLGKVVVEFYAVVVGVLEVEGLADAVVGGAGEGDVVGDESAEGVSELGAGGVEDGEVVEACGVRGRGRRAEGFPGIEADVMVIAAGGEEGGAVAEALGDIEAEDAVVEGEGAFEVGDAEVDVADGDGGVDDGGGVGVHDDKYMVVPQFRGEGRPPVALFRFRLWRLSD